MSHLGQPTALRDYRAALQRLREEFHATGQYDDAGVKLDEVAKLIAMEMHEVRSGLRRLNEASLADRAESLTGDRSKIALALKSLSEEVLASKEFLTSGNVSIFGEQPSLALSRDDDRLARILVSEITTITKHFGFGGAAVSDQFDLLNEAFGSFVRDNFANTKDDAQYMTPHEVVQGMVAMAFADIENDSEAVDRLLNPSKGDPFVIADPTCGVGSFLTASVNAAADLARVKGFGPQEVTDLIDGLVEHSIFGQDKTARMVRLARLNLLLLGPGTANIEQGNSITDPDSLASLHGRIDLIVTNPPFAAEYAVGHLVDVTTSEHQPVVHALARERAVPPRLDSELIMLDRCLSLLRPGGRLLIVLPDSVVSAKGPSAHFREKILSQADLVAVVELPPVTFAQAGTRTRTSFVYLQKKVAADVPVPPACMAVCADLGFEVANRVGVPVKVTKGRNQLPSVIDAYVTGREQAPERFDVLSEDPSVVLVAPDARLDGRWTAGFYAAARLAALNALEDLADSGYELVPVSEVADLCSRTARRSRPVKGSLVISILHVGSDGILDLREVLSYDPKTPPIPCEPGDVLFSKINPRIPRVTVVPDLGQPMACSSEFEVLRVRDGFDPYLLAGLLLSPPVHTQIKALTSGTSSSHNRIKDTELAQVVLPVPSPTGPMAETFAKAARDMASATAARYGADGSLLDALTRLVAPLS